jgi:gliding motility-associated-like protein
MKFLVSIIFLLFFSLQTTVLLAQIPAPTLQCVRRDTLIWQLPTVACGAVQGFNIFYARNRTGPYALLAGLSNPTQTQYRHNNTEGGQWFYYIQTQANCAGQSPRSSDTLDNQLPLLQQVLTLNVLDDGSVEVRWRRSLSPQVVGYVLYKQTLAGLAPIATINSRDSSRYIDASARGKQRSESYQVLAIDGCLNYSLFDVNHSSIFLKAQQDKCQQSINLSWEPYRNWQNPVAKQEIFVGVNERTPSLFATVGASDTAFSIPRVNNRDRYRVFVRAVQAVTNTIARSNDTTVVADVIQPVRQLFLKNVSVNEANRVDLIWQWNDNAKIDSVFILRSTRADSGFVRIRGYKPVLPLDFESDYRDTAVNPNVQPYFYRVETRDACGARVQSNTVATLHLTALPQGKRQNFLAWSPWQFPNTVLLGYQIIRIVKNVPTTLGLPIDTTKRNFLDIATSEEGLVCYRVGGLYRYTLPDGSTEEATSFSNTTCAEQFSGLIVPNAFAPNGINSFFRPVVTFTDNLVAYEMKIYDRWGNLVFKTDNYEAAWDGTKGAQPQPQGVYLYNIKIKQRAGNTVEEKGTLMLIR